MKYEVFVSYDMKMEIYSRPMLSPKKAAFLRDWIKICNDENHPVGQHPEDHCLFKVGDYDDDTGILIPLKAHVSLGKAIDFVNEDVQKGMEDATNT